MSQIMSPITIGSLTLKNRIALAPLTRARADIETHQTNHLHELYYEQRASAGLIITEGSGISEQGHGWRGAPALYNDEQASAWKKVVDRVHNRGGVIFLQLWHTGRQSHPSFHVNNEIVSASAIAVASGTSRDSSGNSVPFATPKALTTSEITLIVKDYKHSAHLARLAGFDGVEIHGANGYLIDSFLQSSTNIRTDEYGGSFENRFRFLREVVEAVREVYPADRIAVRISPNGVFGGMGSSDNYELFKYVAAELSTYKLAFLHVMDGLGFGAHTYKHLTLFDIKTAFPGPVMGNVGFTKEIAEGAIRSGAADLIAFGRPFISNPDLVERFANNWPLAADAPYEHWWTPSLGSVGYTDYPFYVPPQPVIVA